MGGFFWFRCFNFFFFACGLVQVHKVPANDMEALKSPLMGLFEKRRARKFFIYVQNYNESDPKTHEGMDLTRVTTKELIAYVCTCFLAASIIYSYLTSQTQLLCCLHSLHKHVEIDLGVISLPFSLSLSICHEILIYLYFCFIYNGFARTAT